MRLLLVEDNMHLAALIREGLQRAGYVIDVVHRRKAAELALEQVEYDLVILDRGLPDGDGMLLLGPQGSLRFLAPCIVLTARNALHDRVDGLDAGADDYLAKPFAMEELIARVQAVLRRPRTRASSSVVFHDLNLLPNQQQLLVANREVEIPPSEFHALACLARANGQRCSRSRLENSVYGINAAVTPNALEVLIHRLRKRLADAGSTVVIRALRGFGYMLDNPSR